MNSLLAELGASASAAFAAEGLAPHFGVVQSSDRPDLAQFQCNGALSAAKAMKTNPRALAEKIAARLQETGLYSEVAIAGPGFINLKLKDEVLEARLKAASAAPSSLLPKSGAGKRVLLDFGGPNVAKPMHVGHLRSAIIGDCLQRLFVALSWTKLSDVHLGDWGLPMGQLISELAILKPDLPYFADADLSPYPAESPVTMEELEILYPQASNACKADPARLEQARQATAELQAGRPGYRALWRHFFEVSEKGLRREFASLGVTFDMWKGEADAAPLIPPMVEALKIDGYAVMSEGALVVSVAEDGDTKEIPPLILLKSDGAVLYGTTDLATIIERETSFDPDLVLYVVDQRQHGHFEQVFRASRKAGFSGDSVLEHVGYGTVNGTDGKPFKTRAGGVMKLHDLIRMATEEAGKRLAEQGLASDYTDEERDTIARMVGIAAIKFADLSNNRVSGYVFDLERFTRFEGKTGPYLQYAAVRIKSILRRAAEQGFAVGEPVIRSEEERQLALQLLALPETLLAAEEKRAPHYLCDYVFSLAQGYSRFYTEHHILSESDAGLRAARLGLCAATLGAMATVLSILGIELPERM
jgi:arginyl-tRNA synthetase